MAVQRLEKGEVFVPPEVSLETSTTVRGKPRTKVDAFSEVGGTGEVLPSEHTLPAVMLGAGPLPGAVEAVELGVQAGGWAKLGGRIISAEDVAQALKTGDFSALAIPAQPELLPVYRALAKALTAHGPNGASGNGMGLGPVGDEPWNPSELMRAIGGHRGDAEIGGRILGDGGPLGDRYADLDKIAPGLSEQLAPGGLFDALGPFSRLGPAGDTGFLGPVGGHGLGQDLHGNFVRGKKVVRSIALPVGKKKQRFDLVEKYDAETAKKMKDNDASWMIRGGIPGADDAGHRFTFQVKKGQLVMLQVGSESLKDAFGIELIQNGKVVKRSSSTELLNSIRFQAASSGKLEVRVFKLDAPPVTPDWTDLYIQSVTAPVVIGFGLLKPWLELGGMKFKPHPEGAVYRLSCTSSTAGTKGHAVAAQRYRAG
jgi:hypothetical protein